MKYIRILLTVSLFATAILGDFLVFRSKYSNSQIFRAFADTSVHGVIGFLSSLLFFSYGINITSQASLFNVIFCTFASSLIDIDHFIVAKSFYLKDLTNLKQRGIFHCTTFWLLVTGLLLLYSHTTRKLNIYLLTYMLILAFASHHLRDANRRGLWMYPFGHTPPINRYLYLFLICTLPSVVAYIFVHTKPVFKHTIVNYNEIV